ncbi:MAG: family 16 glycosylhydrolase, partial [Clostridia bacterium]|nr:family 16 glycosylhydrolase [Clostridia bacterium]
MKKSMRNLLALLAVVAILCGVMPLGTAPFAKAAAVGEELVVNGDFETGDRTGWSHYASEIKVKAEYARSGGYGIGRAASSTGWANTTQVVSLEPGNTYRLTLYIKGKLPLYVKLGTDGSFSDKNTIYNGLSTTHNYATFTKVTADIDSGSFNSLLIEFSSGGGVDWCVDDVSLVKLEKKYINNGDFETGDLTGWTVPDWCKSSVSATTDNGNTCALISGQGYANIQQRFTVDADTGYRIRVRHKGTLTIYLKEANADGNWKNPGGAEYKSTFSNTSGNWITSTFAITAAEIKNFGITRLGVELSSTSGSALYIDDVIAIVIEPPTTDGYIQNGDFETGDITGWSVKYGSAAASSTNVKDGSFSACITPDNSVYACLRTSFTVESNTNYILTYDHMTPGNSSGITYIKNASTNTNIVSDWPACIPNSWSHESYRFNSGDATSVAIELCTGDATTVRYYDNIRLVKYVENNITGGMSSNMEMTDGKLGVAFKFDVPATVQIQSPFYYKSGTIAPFADGKTYELVRMGAVITNQPVATADLTLDAVNNKTVINITAEKILESEEGHTAFAVRITNVPNTADAKGTTLSARPYYIYKDGDKEIVQYATAVYGESYNSITDHNECAPEGEWELYWSDEFGGTELDYNKWDTPVAYAGTNNMFIKTDRPENVKVENGSLVLTAKKESLKGSSYSVGYVSGAGRFSFIYGRMEVRAKLPYGKGVWPALWTMGDYYLEVGDTNGWPYGGEIDLMELVGEADVTEKKKYPWSAPTYSYTSNPVNEANRTPTHNIHWGADRSAHMEVGSSKVAGYENHYTLPAASAPSYDYHIYAIEWEYRSIKFFVDDVMVNHVKWGTENGKDYLAWYDASGKLTKKIYEITAVD